MNIADRAAIMITQWYPSTPAPAELRIREQEVGYFIVKYNRHKESDVTAYFLIGRDGRCGGVDASQREHDYQHL